MNCPEYQELLLAHLDGHGPADGGALDGHLQACAACRALSAAVGRLEEGLRLTAPPLPPIGFAGAVVHGVLADQRARRRRRLVYRIGALAAAVLLAVVLRTEHRWLGVQEKNNGLSVQQSRRTEPVPAVAPEKPLPLPSPLELASQVPSLPRRVAEETTLSKWSLSMDVLPAPTEPAEPALEKAAQSLTEARQGMVVAWEAVEGPMRRATTAWSRLTPSLQKD